MDFQALNLHLQEFGIAYFLGAMVIIPIIVVFRKYTLPAIFHVVEYTAYFGMAHLFIAGLTRTFSWFRAETSFKNYNGDVSPDFVPFTTPVSLDFWRRELYTPQWLFWFEVGVALLLLYVVVFVRPMHFKNKTYKSKKPKPGKLSSRQGSERRYGASVR